LGFYKIWSCHHVPRNAEQLIGFKPPNNRFLMAALHRRLNQSLRSSYLPVIRFPLSVVARLARTMTTPTLSVFSLYLVDAVLHFAGCQLRTLSHRKPVLIRQPLRKLSTVNVLWHWWQITN
jgi:hypothetical protein